MQRFVDLTPAVVASLCAALGLSASCKSASSTSTASSGAGGHASGSGGGASVASSSGNGGTIGAGGTGTGTGGAGGGGGPTAPPPAAAAGYLVNTFTSTFAKDTIDLGDTKTTGFAWYLGQFFGGPDTPANDLTFNADGTLGLDGAGTASNSGINTATRSTSNAAGWVGVAFGGGAYFEATFKFDPQDTINTNGMGWPSWWAMAIEHLAGLPSAHWPGQAANYDHFIETDFFEYDVWSFTPHNEYGGAMHDWWGIYQSTCPSGFCAASNSGTSSNFNDFEVHTPTATDFTQFHTFGFLWVPATATTQGRATYYFDRKATNDVVTWSQFTTQAPPPGTAPWTFGILDQQHLALILGTGPNEPMTLQSVNVWQASAAGNLVE